MVACNAYDSADDQAAAKSEQAVINLAAGNAQALQKAEERALEQLFEVQPSLLQGVDDVWTKNVRVDRLGEAHTRLTQTLDNIPVWGGEAIVHLRADGSFKSMTDKFVRNLAVDTTPGLEDFQAIDLAVASEGGWAKVTGAPEAELYIVRKDGADHLAYRVQIEQFEASAKPAMPVVFIDAHSGEIINRYNDLKTARNRRTYDANNGTSLPGTFRRGESDGATGDAILDEAHDNAGTTYNYYNSRFGRDSFNNNGATITSTVHYSNNYVNAFWNGSQMVYGDGDNQTSTALTVLDVVGHELTHAVTDYESDLIYQNESGALNEAMSDIMAAGIEYYANPSATFEDIWYIGEDCWLAEPALRYMNDPEQGGDYDYYPTRYQGSQDNGGVHWNSGIANLAFHLLSVGGTHPRNKTTVQVPAIGIQKAEQIFYRANTTYLTASSNFEDARNATASAAADLYTQTEVDAVHLAWDAVGVPGGNTEPPPADCVLANGDTIGNLSGSTGDWYHCSIEIPAGASNFVSTISGGSGDADLYVNFNTQPTTSSYDCRPYKVGNNETCTIAAPSAGTYWVSIRAYSSYSGVSLSVSYDGGGGDQYPGLELDESNLSGSSGSWGQQYSLSVPADATTLDVVMSGGSGDGDLYVRYGAAPTTSSYDCRPYKWGNEETCSFTNPSAGTWYIWIRGYSSYSGVSLTADYSSN